MAKKRNWNDVQITIAAISVASVLGFWNMFAGPDRQESLRRVAETQAQAAAAQQTQEQVDVTAPVSPTPAGIILLGGSAPQTVITIQQPSASQGGGGGGAASVTSTRTS